MKKHICFLSLLLLLLFAGCRQEKVYKIGVSQCSSDDWRSKMNAEMMREIMFHDDAVLEIRSADDNSRKQIDDIRYFADNGFDIIIVAPNEADALTPVISEVYENGIPVVIFDRDIKGESYTARIGVDNRGMGHEAAIYARQLLGDKPCNILEIQGLHGSTPASDRHNGFVAVADSLKGMNMLASVNADWYQDKAHFVADSLLRLYPQTSLIYAHNDRMAIGASEAARALGRDDIRIIGIDAAPSIGIKAVADNIIDASFIYPTEGHRIIRRALDILKGHPYPRNEEIPLTSAVDRTNADILLQQNGALVEETNKIKVLKAEVDRYWQEHSSQTNLFYATLLILALLFVLVFLLLRAFWTDRRHRTALEEKNRLLAEERDKQAVLNAELAKATQSKLVFFTNVSHDLRTPLTLIADPVEQLVDADNLTPRQRVLMSIAHKNIKILRRLINQILDFRKYDSGKLEVALTEVDFRQQLGEWVASFAQLARKRHIRLNVNISEHGNSLLAIDVEKIERVVFNLLSNAFKYTPDNGAITVACRFSDSETTFSVADTGIGISSDDIGRVFENFYQVEKIHPKGSGIGLWLSRAFVELHGGHLTVESHKGEGSVFTVVLPVKHVASESQKPESQISGDEIDSELTAVDISGVASDANDGKPLVLVIDDNADMRLMLTTLLSDDYRVLRAVNGKEGVRMAMKFVPDLIICDVMMPEMDGMECCRIIKEEVATSHIPVLMLTACAMDEQRVAGFNNGADGYLPKPFSNDVLKAQCHSLITNRRRIRNLFDNRAISSVLSSERNVRPVSPLPDSLAVSDIDSDFYNRFLSIVDRELGNSDLSVDSLAAEMGLGRSQFYRKIKALTNYSPVELLRNIRLQKARTLLATTEKSISEIAYETGFSTPAYFTKCFRDYFDTTPTDLRMNLGRK